MSQTLCKDCIYWQADPHDNGMGECTGLVTAIEVNAGSYGADELEFYTPATWYCAAAQSKDEGTKAHDKEEIVAKNFRPLKLEAGPWKGPKRDLPIRRRT